MAVLVRSRLRDRVVVSGPGQGFWGDPAGGRFQDLSSRISRILRASASGGMASAESRGRGPGFRPAEDPRACARNEQRAQRGPVLREPLRPGDTVAVGHDDVAEEKVDVAGEGPVHLIALGAVLGLEQAIAQLLENRPVTFRVSSSSSTMRTVSCHAVSQRVGLSSSCATNSSVCIARLSHHADALCLGGVEAAAPGGARSHAASFSSAGSAADLEQPRCLYNLHLLVECSLNHGTFDRGERNPLIGIVTLTRGAHRRDLSGGPEPPARRVDLLRHAPTAPRARSHLLKLRTLPGQ